MSNPWDEFAALSADVQALLEWAVFECIQDGPTLFYIRLVANTRHQEHPTDFVCSLIVVSEHNRTTFMFSFE